MTTAILLLLTSMTSGAAEGHYRRLPYDFRV